jgi:hypothetical protein
MSRGARLVAASTVGVVLAAGLAACIIPDREIGIEGNLDNPGAVRIVQPIPLLDEMLDICNLPLEERDTAFCPQVPPSLHSGLIRRAPDEPFCVCPSGADLRSQPEFFVYAEDPDRAQDRPVDQLYGVLLLDFDAAESDEPQNAVAYAEQLPPGVAAELVLTRNVGDGDSLVVASEGREDNLLWRFRVGKDGGGGTDLCNDNEGRALTPGLHNLTMMVTDRPFFQPELLDVDGEPVLDQAGRPVLAGTQYGMPDLAIGATYAVANWVFECHDPVVNSQCDCAEVDG